MWYQHEYGVLSTTVADTGSTSIGIPMGVSALAFDNEEELLWMGNQGGHATSYFGHGLQKYTSFQVFDMQDVRDILTGPFGVLTLNKNQLRCNIRRGLVKFRHSSELMKEMQCMTLLPSGLITMSGHQSQMIEFDLERMKQIRITEVSEGGCVILRQLPRYLCCGDVTGNIALRDQLSMKVIHNFQTHSGMLSDFDVRGNYLVTCGYSLRDGNYYPDRFLMVFDLRMNRATAPIQATFSPHLLRFIPAFTSRFCLVSQTGQFQLLDVTESGSASFINQIDMLPGASISAFDVSQSCQALAFADDQGCISLYGTNPEVNFNRYSRETEFADPIEAVPSIDINDLSATLSQISISSYCDPNDKLFSDLPRDMCDRKYTPAPGIDEKIMKAMKMVDQIGYVQNPYRARGGRIAYVKGKLGVIGGTPDPDEEEEKKKKAAAEAEEANASEANGAEAGPSTSSADKNLSSAGTSQSTASTSGTTSSR